MDFFDVVQGRRSIRKFLPDPVPREDLEEIIRVGTLAANADNNQMWRFVVVTNRTTLKSMEEAVLGRIKEVSSWPESKNFLARLESTKVSATYFSKAPCGIAVFGEPYSSAMDDVLASRGVSREERDRLRPRPDLQSIGAAIQNMLLAAHAKGFGAVWMTGPCIAAREIEAILGAREPWKLVAIVALGKHSQSPSPGSRKAVSEVSEFIE